MNTYTTKQDQFSALLSIFGNHSNAAKALGLSVRHYRKLRAGKHKSPMAEKLIPFIIYSHKTRNAIGNGGGNAHG